VIGALDGQQYRSTLIQVVPRRTAEPSGVADYALALARALRANRDANSVFLSGTPPADATPVEDGWETVCVPKREAPSLADTLQLLSAESNARAVVLHFSGYGYEKRGVPVWLVQGLQIWRRRAGRVPLLTIFHELYATGRPWQRSFWVSPFQKNTARNILKLSSAAITPTDLYKKRLSEWRDGDATEITAMPVFSNMGEPGCGPAPCARTAAAVVFGLAGVEDYIFGIYRSEIERIISTLGIEKIFDVGPRLSAMPGTLAGVPVISKGVLPQGAVSELLQRARFGFVAYPLDFVAKSGVFAAYAAHGVVPIVLSDKQGTFDGLQPARHFLDGLRLGTSAGAEDLTSIQHQLFTWYTSHSLKVQAEFLANSIRTLGGTEYQKHA
jgi:Glycosyl transferase 4-like domain